MTCFIATYCNPLVVNSAIKHHKTSTVIPIVAVCCLVYINCLSNYQHVTYVWFPIFWSLHYVDMYRIIIYTCIHACNIYIYIYIYIHTYIDIHLVVWFFPWHPHFSRPCYVQRRMRWLALCCHPRPAQGSLLCIEMCKNHCACASSVCIYWPACDVIIHFIIHHIYIYIYIYT